VAVLGGALWALWYVGASLVGGEAYQAYNRSMPVVLVLLAVGLLALHAAQEGGHGPLGRSGLVVALVGLAVMLVGNVADFWVFAEEGYGPASPKHSAWMLFGLGMAALYVGTVLFGIGTLRAGALPRLGALLLLVWFPLGFVVSGLLQLVGVPEGLAFSGMTGLLGAGWVVLGYAVWSQRGAVGARPRRVR
jgi:hypothetical protein